METQIEKLSQFNKSLKDQGSRNTEESIQLKVTIKQENNKNKISEQTISQQENEILNLKSQADKVY